jgi:hypothetical protein
LSDSNLEQCWVIILAGGPYDQHGQTLRQRTFIDVFLFAFIYLFICGLFNNAVSGLNYSADIRNKATMELNTTHP